MWVPLLFLVWQRNRSLTTSQSRGRQRRGSLCAHHAIRGFCAAGSRRWPSDVTNTGTRRPPSRARSLSSEVTNVLVFRDWLRTAEADRHLYADTKKQLAEQQWVDMN